MFDRWADAATLTGSDRHLGAVPIKFG